MASLPWVIKYRPAKFTELVFSDDTHFEALKWLRNFKSGSLLNITGGCGIGKSLLVNAIAKVLNYNVLEFSELKIETFNDLETSRNIDGKRNLLLIEEFDIPSHGWINRFSNFKIPVIITSSTSVGKNLKVLKIRNPSNEAVLNCIEAILLKEDAFIDRTTIFKLCTICNNDIRSIINYCQLLSKTPTFHDLKILERFFPGNIFKICKDFLNRRMRLVDLEKLFSVRIADICLNSALQNCSSQNMMKTMVAFSDIYSLPEKYHFLALEPLNQLQTDFIYTKEMNINISNKHGNEDVMNYFPFYKRNLQDRSSVFHLQKIFETYNIENLSETDKEIKNYIFHNPIDSKVFKYHYNQGSSSAVKRDITISELLDL